MAKEKSEQFKIFEGLNNQYGSDKKAYETIEADKAELKKLELAVFDAKQTLLKMQSENDRVKIAGGKAPHDKAAMEAAATDLKKAVSEVEKHKEKVQKALDKVNNRFKQLEKNPEMKKQLDSILATRLERSMKRSKKEIENYEQVKTILEEHPNVKGTMQGIVNNNRKIASLTAKIEKIEAKPEADRTDEEKQTLIDSKQELTDVKTELAGRKTQLETFLNKQYPDLSDEQKNFIYDMNTMNISKAIAGKERDIANRQKAYKEVTGKEYEGVTEKEEASKNTNAKEAKEKSGLPAKVGRWQRFKNWFKSVWSGEKTSTKDTKEPEEKPDKSKKAGSEFRSAYKYDIVQDYIAQKENELIKDAASKNRKQGEQEKDEGR